METSLYQRFVDFDLRKDVEKLIMKYNEARHILRELGRKPKDPVLDLRKAADLQFSCFFVSKFFALYDMQVVHKEMGDARWIKRN